MLAMAYLGSKDNGNALPRTHEISGLSLIASIFDATNFESLHQLSGK